MARTGDKQIRRPEDWFPPQRPTNTPSTGDIDGSISDALTAVDINTTAPITGGGNLSTDLTLALNGTKAEFNAACSDGDFLYVGDVTGGSGGIPEAPTDGKQYGRQSSAWSEVIANPTWTTLAGKPATFPPTLPIAESDVTNLVTDLAAKAPLNSPPFTGNPTAPTPSAGDNDTSIATTAFVTAAVAGSAITDGDKGDVVVSGSGTVLTVESATPVDGSFDVTGSIIATGGGIVERALPAGNAPIYLQDDTGLNQGILYWSRSDDTVRLRRYPVSGSGAEGEFVLTAAGATLSYRLTLFGDLSVSSADPTINLNGTAGSSAVLSFTPFGGGLHSLQGYAGQLAYQSDQQHVFYTDATTRLIINDAGLVVTGDVNASGVGVFNALTVLMAAPWSARRVIQTWNDTGRTLNVYGRAVDDATSAFEIGTANELFFSTDNVERLRIGNGGVDSSVLLSCPNLNITQASGTRHFIYFRSSGSVMASISLEANDVELLHNVNTQHTFQINNTTRLAITAAGVSVTGTITTSAGCTFNGDVTVKRADGSGALFLGDSGGRYIYGTITAMMYRCNSHQWQREDNGSIIMNLTSAGLLTTPGGVLVNGAAASGYATGAGGSVTQLTSKSTPVTLNRPCGRIITTADSIAANSSAFFVLNNSLIGVYDCILVQLVNGNGSLIIHVDQILAGSVRIQIWNRAASADASVINLNFTIIKGSNA